MNLSHHQQNMLRELIDITEDINHQIKQLREEIKYQNQLKETSIELQKQQIELLSQIAFHLRNQ